MNENETGRGMRGIRYQRADYTGGWLRVNFLALQNRGKLCQMEE